METDALAAAAVTVCAELVEALKNAQDPESRGESKEMPDGLWEIMGVDTMWARGLHRIQAVRT